MQPYTLALSWLSRACFRVSALQLYDRTRHGGSRHTDHRGCRISESISPDRNSDAVSPGHASARRPVRPSRGAARRGGGHTTGTRVTPRYERPTCVFVRKNFFAHKPQRGDTLRPPTAGFSEVISALRSPACGESAAAAAGRVACPSAHARTTRNSVALSSSAAGTFS